MGMNDMRKILADKLKFFRERSGLTSKEVGKAIGKSEKTISAWEHGRGQPDADKLIELCSIYSASIGEFFDQPTNSLDTNAEGMVYARLSNSQKQLLSVCESLSEDGLAKVIEYASDMVASGKYKKINANERAM